jgi:hypothetical protein
MSLITVFGLPVDLVIISQVLMIINIVCCTTTE